MKKNSYLQFIASLLVSLVLTIPFYTTSVYASISKVSVKGIDGIDGYAKSRDSLAFSIEASISNDTITNEQVVLGTNIKFNNCISAANGSECNLRLPANGTESFEAKSLPFTINLFKDDNTLDDSRTSRVTIDSKAPQVKLSSNQKFSSQQQVVINYDVTDFACDDPSCANKCVGIKNIEFFTSDGAFRQVIESKELTVCSMKSSISIDPKTFNDGQNSIFAKSTDRFNQISAEASATFAVDASAPSILPASLSIIRKGVTLNAFSSKKIPAEVVVNISGNDLDLNSVTADLSSLNPNGNLKSAKASCTSAEDVSTCKWLIDLNPGKPGPKSVTINVADNSGNKETVTVTKQLGFSDKGPVVKSLATITSTEEKVFGKTSGNTVIAMFEEPDGLAADEVFLHVDNAIPAGSCTREFDWKCTWEDVNFAAGEMSIQTDTTDILGNPVAEASHVDLVIDKSTPVLRSLNITAVGGIAQAFEGFAKIGDKIAVQANLTEENDVIAFADFSKFITGATKVAGSCQRIQADEHTCSWVSDSINLEATDSIAFNFSDNAGNSLTAARQFKTFGLENATVPDFWENTVSCSPKAIDRQLGPLINQRVYCTVLLTSKSKTKPVSTVFIGDASCASEQSLVQNVETFNAKAGSTSPVLKITLKKDDFKTNNATISCSMSIFSKVGSTSTITQNPEIENVRIDLQFSSLPLGELSEGVQEKIKAAKDDTKGILSMMTSLNKLMHIARKICQLFGIIYNIIAIYHTITILLSAKTDISCTSILGVAVCPLLYSTKTKTCFEKERLKESTDKGYSLTGNKFCKFVNCQWAPGILGQWQGNMAKRINELPGSEYLPRTEYRTQSGQNVKDELTSGFARYYNIQSSLIASTAFACIPGIVYNLDKYRQIKCLYADCLENAVGKEGLPVTACEDEKAYATCKYVTGEAFAVIPYTAVLDYFIRLIKNALSNPFGVIGVGVSAYCYSACSAGAPASTTVYTTCATVRLLSTMGEVLGNVKNIIDEGFTIRQDYCSRLADDSKNKEKIEDKGNTTTKK